MRKTFRLKGSFSAHYLPNLKVNVWPTKKLKKKNKKILVKKTKFFSAELGTVLLKYKINYLFFVKKMQKNVQLPNTNIFMPKIQRPKKRFYAHNISNIAFKNFWFLKNAALVPGIHKIRKPKSFSLVQKNSNKILCFWLGNSSCSKICKFLHKTNVPFGFKKDMLFITGLESLPIVLFQKAFVYKNAFMLQPQLRSNHYKGTNAEKITVNGFFISRQWSVLFPADVFCMENQFTITNNNITISKNLL